jgi:hypothetical protein
MVGIATIDAPSFVCYNFVHPTLTHVRQPKKLVTEKVLYLIITANNRVNGLTRRLQRTIGKYTGVRNIIAIDRFGGEQSMGSPSIAPV